LTQNFLEEYGEFDGERLPVYIEVPWKIAGVRTTGGAYVHDLFRFSDDDFEPDPYPNWNFGVGLSSYSPDFSGLAAAFDSIENKYRKQGKTIRHHELDFNVSPLLWFTIKIQFFRQLALLLETGTSIASGKNAVLEPVSASILYYFDPLNVNWFHSYVGAGIGHYHCIAEQAYGDPLGERKYLASIRSEGGKIGFSLTGGIEINLLKRLCLTFHGKYLMIPVLEANTNEGAVGRVKLSGLLGGTQLSLTF
jgi:opacity protein-like surface antigen